RPTSVTCPYTTRFGSRIAVAGEDVQEMRRPVAHGDGVRHAELFQRLRLEGERIGRRIGARMAGHVDQRAGGELHGAEAGVEVARDRKSTRLNQSRDNL